MNAHVPFGSVCSLQNGRAFKPSEWSDDGTPIVRIQNLNDESKPFNYCDFEVEQRFHVDSGDLLFSWSGTPGTSFGAFFWNRGKGFLNQHIFRVDVDEGVTDKDYLRHAINSKLNMIIDQAHGGVGLKHITKGKLEAIEIYHPPLPEQKRIAAILDKADAIHRKRQQAIQLADEFLRSVFLEMFGSAEYPIVRIGEMLEKGILVLHKDGNHGSLYPRREDFGDRGIPFVSTKCFTDDGSIDDQLVPRLKEEKANQLRIGWIEKGDVLLAHNATVGPVGLYDGQYERALIGTSLTAFRPNQSDLVSEYLYAALKSMFFQGQLFQLMKQTTRNQVPITAQRTLKIPLPPIGLQKNFAKILRKHLELRKVSENHGGMALNEFSSLAQYAFRGEL